MKQFAPMILVLAWAATLCASAQREEAVAKLEDPLGAQGTVTFQIQTDKEYHTGPNVAATAFDVLEIPGVSKVQFRQLPTVCELRWVWARGVAADDLGVQIPELPGPDEYFVQYTWDAPSGRFTGYVNGTALRLPRTQLPLWSAPEGAEVQLAAGPFKTTLVSCEGRYLDEAEARAQVPQELLGRHAGLFGAPEKEPAPVDVASRLGERLYASGLDTQASIEGWVMEGPGVKSFEEGWMTMASERPNSAKKDGHIVHWCPEDFPESFVAEWEMQITSEYGLCIVFFAARGLEGEDVFAPNLPKRTGIFRQYHSGGINCYHISYYASTPSSPGRITSNMRKNKGFHLVTNGPPGIPPGSEAIHAVRLIKDGAHVQLQVDGKVVIDFTDDGERYGPVLGGGKIGLRQMQWTVGRYRNFRVHELRSK